MFFLKFNNNNLLEYHGIETRLDLHYRNHPLLVDSRKKRGGGVGLYAKETFCYRVEKKLTTNNLQIISVSVQLKKSKLLISCV